MPHDDRDLRCTAKNARGEPCGSPSKLVDPKSGFCPSHDPEKREKLREAARKGGQATARKFQRDGLTEEDLPELRTPQDAGRRLDLIGRAVGTGRLGHAEGRTMTGAVRQWLKAYEVGEMADEIETLRAKLREFEGSKLKRVK